MSSYRILIGAATLLGALIAASPSQAQVYRTSSPNLSNAVTSPGAAHAWEDRSDEVMDSFNTVSGRTILLVTAASVGVLTTVYLLSRRNRKEAPEQESDDTESARSEASIDADRLFPDRTPKTIDERVSEARRHVPIDVVMGVQPTGPAERAVTMGFSLTF